MRVLLDRRSLRLSAEAHQVLSGRVSQAPGPRGGPGQRAGWRITQSPDRRPAHRLFLLDRCAHERAMKRAASRLLAARSRSPPADQLRAERMHAGRGVARTHRADDADARGQAPRRNQQPRRRVRLDGLGRVVQLADGQRDCLARRIERIEDRDGAGGGPRGQLRVCVLGARAPHHPDRRSRCHRASPAAQETVVRPARSSPFAVSGKMPPRNSLRASGRPRSHLRRNSLSRVKALFDSDLQNRAGCPAQRQRTPGRAGATPPKTALACAAGPFGEVAPGTLPCRKALWPRWAPVASAVGVRGVMRHPPNPRSPSRPRFPS